jgi:hypothetical protein
VARVRALAASATPAEQQAEKTDIEQHMRQVAEAIGDENSARILAITSREDWSGERKMEEILRLDSRFAGKNSSQWGEAGRLTCSPCCKPSTNPKGSVWIWKRPG